MKSSKLLVWAGAIATMAWVPLAHATLSSAELYTTKSYQYGRFEASIRFAAGSGVVGAFFLWKDGSEVAGTYWNELDIEKIGANCQLHTNAYYGNPAKVHTLNPTVAGDLCGSFHTYAYEWTPEYIAWFLDGTEIRRETGDAVTAYAENATAGMQFRFNTWPGDATFGGVFDPSILPVYQNIDWVQYSTYASGSFQLAWREDFTATSLPSGWAVGSWGSPKNLSTHSPNNVSFVDGVAILALTDDAATGTGGTSSGTGGTSSGIGGAAAGAPQSGGSTSTVGASGPASGDESGCSCRAGAASPPYARGAMFLLGAILIGWSRRQRKERPQRRLP